MNDFVEQFRNALADAGVILHPSESIRADGVLHRARSADDRPGKLSCWYRLHLDSPIAGAGGDWRTGARLTWCAKRLSALTSAEREALRLRIEQDRRRAQAETERRHRDAAARAARIWANAKPASPAHPYLQRKGIAPGIARESRGALVLPVVDLDKALHGLQFIDEQGGKKFLRDTAKKGHFLPVTGPLDDSRPIYLVEGWATGMTVASMRPSVQVAAAGDAGNLLPLAIAVRERWPNVSLVIAPDFDEVGQAKGHDAAIAARAKILPMPVEIPHGCSDWNDWANYRRGVHHVA